MDRVLPKSSPILTQQLGQNIPIGDFVGFAALGAGSTYQSRALPAFIQQPHLGIRRSLQAVNIPIAFLFGVVAGTPNVGLNHVFNLTLMRNYVPAFSVDVGMAARFAFTFGQDYYAANVTLNANFPNPLDVLNGDQMHWQFTYLNSAGVTIQTFATLSLITLFGINFNGGLPPKSGSFQFVDLPLTAPTSSQAERISITGDVIQSGGADTPITQQQGGGVRPPFVRPP